MVSTSSLRVRVEGATFAVIRCFESLFACIMGRKVDSSSEGTSKISGSLSTARAFPVASACLGAFPQLVDRFFVVVTTLRGRSGEGGSSVGSGDGVGIIDGLGFFPYVTTFLRRSAEVKLDTIKAMLCAVVVVVLLLLLWPVQTLL